MGDVVKKGDILAKLDDREALARLNQAKASYDLSKQVLDRFEDLRQKGHISIQDLDRAKSDFTISKSQFEFYKVKLEQTSLISPFDAVIQSRFLDIEGESFTELKDKIIFQIPVSPPEYGFVTCSLDKCSNLKLANEEKITLFGVSAKYIDHLKNDKYNSKNLSVPSAMYLLPVVSTNECWFLTTPTILSLTSDAQPPTFSGSPYLKRTLSLSIQRFSAPLVVFCLSIPGIISKLIRAM